jgi:taurine dioxygenase
MSLNLKTLNADFGAEVVAADLARLDDNLVDAILDALLEHALLLFRWQSLDDAALAALAKALGPVGIASKTSCLAPGHPEVMYVSNLQDADGRLIGGLGPKDHSESIWHSDQSFRQRPATLSTLFCVHPPAQGGGTGFVSTTLACDALPQELRTRLDGMRTLYRARAGHEIESVEVSHAAVVSNPRTGRRALYVSELCHGFEGLEPAAGEALRDELMTYVLRPQHRYTHHWRMGDMVIYDNAQLLHRREAFSGMRWLKATRSYAPAGRFAIID